MPDILPPAPPNDTGVPVVPGSLTYGVLTQRHDTYDDKLLTKLEDLYVGGWQIQKKAEQYLPRLPGEGDDRYRCRVETATYQPHFGQIVDQFTSDVFEQSLDITPQSDAKDKTTPGVDTTDDFYTDFAKDADGRGTSLADVLRGLLTTALKHRKALLCVDAPEDAAAAPPASRAEEDARGLRRCYAYELPIASLVDWETNDDGDFTWAIIAKRERIRATPLSVRGSTTETFTVWSMGAGGKAEWSRYAITYGPKDPPTNETLVTRVGGPSTTNFDAIPLHVLELTEGLWVGNKIGPNALEHWRRRSALIGAQNDSLCAIPWVALGPEIPAMGEGISESTSDPERGNDPVRQMRGKGYTVLGKDETLDFAEPSGGCYELVDKQLDKLRDEMFAVNHQMAASVRTNTTALGRSGQSKQADKASTNKVNCALGHAIREFALELYECIAAARGDENVLWSAHGMEVYEQDDREQVLEEAISLDQVQIPSKTFRKLHKFQVAKKLAPNATPAELDVIRDEIEKGVESEQDMRDLQDEVQKDALENPQPPTPPTAGPPKAPTAKPPAAPAAKPPGQKAA